MPSLWIWQYRISVSSREQLTVGNYKVIILSGSTRYKEAFIDAQKRLTLERNMVINAGLFGHSGDNEVWDGMDEGTISKTKEMFGDMCAQA